MHCNSAICLLAHWGLLGSALAVGFALCACGAARAAPLDAYQWSNRPLVVFAPQTNHPGYARILRLIREESAAIEDRDMVVLRVVANAGFVNGEPLPAADVRTLRERFKVRSDEFVMVLVGKDGGVKGRYYDPQELYAVFRDIDGMPMRQREMRERGK
jgi:hypothetical protein